LIAGFGKISSNFFSFAFFSAGVWYAHVLPTEGLSQSFATRVRLDLYHEWSGLFPIGDGFGDKHVRILKLVGKVTVATDVDTIENRLCI
jgi:hypothetical protein